LICEIKGLEPKKFPIIAEVKGTPVVVGANQLGVDYKGIYPFYDFGCFMRNVGICSKEIRITNTGPKDVEIE
jgi:hypothetical protein